MLIKRGLLQSFDPSSYTASVLFFEATSFTLSGLPVANHIDGSSALLGSLCAVLFFDEHNPADAVVLALFPNGAAGFPTPAPGRLTLVAGYRQIYNDVISSGTSTTYTLTGGGSGIPGQALGVLFKAYFTSASVGAYIQLAPHGAADPGAYASIGNMPLANGFMNMVGILPLDPLGRADIRANSGSCSVTLYTYGYVL